MNHPFGPLLLVGLIQAEPAHEARDREHLRAYVESHRCDAPSVAERIRAFARARTQTSANLADCACPA
ncbi:MAG TPA: hypothetical protein VIK65_14155 [Candidatus Limnocylindrales bacterium]|jgi:hypothetical protein